MKNTAQLHLLLSASNQASRNNNFFTIFPLLPIILLRCLIIVIYYVLDIFFILFSSPAQTLEIWQKNTSKDTHPATEAVISLCTTPVIFFFNIILSFCSFGFSILWLLIMCFTYLITLGKIKWQPNFFDFSSEFQIDSKPYKANIGIINIYFIFSFIVSILSTTHFILSCFNNIFNSINLSTIGSYATMLHTILIVIINPIIFTAKIPANNNANILPNTNNASLQETKNTNLLIRDLKVSNNSTNKKTTINQHMTWQCKKCGATNSSTAIFCRDCGKYK